MLEISLLMIIYLYMIKWQNSGSCPMINFYHS